MTSSHDLVEYIFLEYISSLDFISNVLENVETEDDLDYVLYYVAWSAIRAFGYKTDLTYRNLQKDFKKDFARRGIFIITRDNLFGEKCEFDLDKYLEYVAALKAKSSAYTKIATQRAAFGDDGLNRALSITALEHKWEPITSSEGDRSENAFEASVTPRIYLVGESERLQVVAGLRELTKIADDEQLDQQTKSQAFALVNAAICLAEAPMPNWRLIREILYSIAALSTVFGLAIQIAELIR